MRPPVVMIHGAFCGGWAFDELARAVRRRKGYDVHTPTLRYHDVRRRPAVRHSAPTSMLDYVGDLEALLDEFDEPPILIGHSHGRACWRRCWPRVGSVRALVLLAPCAPWGMLPSTPFEMRRPRRSIFAGDFWNQHAEAHTLDRRCQRARHAAATRERDAVFARFVPESGLATFEIMHWAFDLKRATQIDARAMSRVRSCASPAAATASIRRLRCDASRSAIVAARATRNWTVTATG